MQEHWASPRMALKRQGLIRDVQNLSRESIKRRARSHLHTFVAQDEISALIDTTSHSIKCPQLDRLVSFANLHYPRAVAHLGNLVLDGVITIQQLQQYQLKPGYHPFWLWLIEVLVEKEYLTHELFEHTICSLSAKRSEHTVKRALSIVYRLVVSQVNTSLLLRDERAILSILNAALRPDSASDLAYLVLFKLAQTSQLIQKVQGSLRPRFLQVLIQGTLKIEPRKKTLTFKILNALIRHGLFFEELSQTVHQVIKQPAQEQWLELSLQYLAVLVGIAPKQQVIEMLDLGLIIDLGRLREEMEGDHEVVCRVIRVGRELSERAREWGYLQKGVFKELQKYNLLTYSNILQSSL